MGSEGVLGHLAAYGPAALAVLLLLGGMGVPVPATLALIACGAFAGQGRFSAPLVFAAGVVGATAGDAASYLMGRYGLRGLIKRLEKKKSFHRAEARFRVHGPATIFLTRFLLTPLALPTNLIAGSNKFALVRFVGLCAAGEIVWVLVYGGLGFAFAETWQRVAAHAGRASIWIVVGLAVVVAAYELATHWHGHLAPHNETAENTPQTKQVKKGHIA